MRGVLIIVSRVTRLFCFCFADEDEGEGRFKYQYSDELLGGGEYGVGCDEAVL